MRKILLIVAMLLIVAVPAMATVTVNAKHVGLPLKTGVPCTACEVNYVCSNNEKVRAFALEITLTNGYTFTSIQDFSKGESNKAGNPRGFGIFPGKFRDVINPTTPNWADPCYNPIAPAVDADAAGTGIGTNKIVVEMGSLYAPYGSGDVNGADMNGPLYAAKLFRFDIAGPGGVLTDIGIAANATRGGVVLEDGTTIPLGPTTLVLNGHTGVGFPECFPCWQPYSPQYTEFLAVYKPNCWCGQYAAADTNGSRSFQCYGDADAKIETGFKYRVYNSDYKFLSNYWKKTAAQLRLLPNGLCTDFDHQKETAFSYRVYNSDYKKLTSSWKKTDAQLTALGGLCPK